MKLTVATASAILAFCANAAPTPKDKKTREGEVPPGPTSLSLAENGVIMPVVGAAGIPQKSYDLKQPTAADVSSLSVKFSDRIGGSLNDGQASELQFPHPDQAYQPLKILPVSPLDHASQSTDEASAVIEHTLTQSSQPLNIISDSQVLTTPPAASLPSLDLDIVVSQAPAPAMVKRAEPSVAEEINIAGVIQVLQDYKQQFAEYAALAEKTLEPYVLGMTVGEALESLKNIVVDTTAPFASILKRDAFLTVEDKHLSYQQMVEINEYRELQERIDQFRARAEHGLSKSVMKMMVRDLIGMALSECFPAKSYSTKAVSMWGQAVALSDDCLEMLNEFNSSPFYIRHGATIDFEAEKAKWIKNLLSTSGGHSVAKPVCSCSGRPRTDHFEVEDVAFKVFEPLCAAEDRQIIAKTHKSSRTATSSHKHAASASPTSDRAGHLDRPVPHKPTHTSFNDPAYHGLPSHHTSSHAPHHTYSLEHPSHGHSHEHKTHEHSHEHPIHTLSHVHPTHGNSHGHHSHGHSHVYQTPLSSHSSKPSHRSHSSWTGRPSESSCPIREPSTPSHPHSHATAPPCPSITVTATHSFTKVIQRRATTHTKPSSPKPAGYHSSKDNSSKPTGYPTNVPSPKPGDHHSQHGHHDSIYDLWHGWYHGEKKMSHGWYYGHDKPSAGHSSADQHKPAGHSTTPSNGPHHLKFEFSMKEHYNKKHPKQGKDKTGKQHEHLAGEFNHGDYHVDEHSGPHHDHFDYSSREHYDKLRADQKDHKAGKQHEHPADDYWISGPKDTKPPHHSIYNLKEHQGPHHELVDHYAREHYKKQQHDSPPHQASEKAQKSEAKASKNFSTKSSQRRPQDPAAPAPAILPNPFVRPYPRPNRPNGFGDHRLGGPGS